MLVRSLRPATFLQGTSVMLLQSSPAVASTASKAAVWSIVQQTSARWSSTAADNRVAPHPKLGHDPNAAWTKQEKDEQGNKQENGKEYMLRYPIYSEAQLSNIQQTHAPVSTFREKIAYSLVQTARSLFDKATKYDESKGTMTERQWLNRVVFLESIAGVPGMVGAVLRHLRSLRLMRRDHGWIHTLLEESENERMHLLTFLKISQPSTMMRLSVLGAQGVFFNLFFMSYILSPRICHRFVGYLEEEAVRTYTHCLADIAHPGSPIAKWASDPAPDIAKGYWRLGDNATILDVVRAVRADEAEHRDVNHTLASLSPDDPNPF